MQINFLKKYEICGKDYIFEDPFGLITKPTNHFSIFLANSEKLKTGHANKLFKKV